MADKNVAYVHVLSTCLHHLPQYSSGYEDGNFYFVLKYLIYFPGWFHLIPSVTTPSYKKEGKLPLVKLLMFTLVIISAGFCVVGQ